MIREEIENIINKYACGASSDDEDSINQWYEDYITEILSLITTEIEKVENPYYQVRINGGFSNKYPEFGVFEECRQSILNLLKEAEMKPTEEQIKELWEWCGFAISGERYYLPGITVTYLIGQPRIDLNNLFKWAVPKLIENGKYPYLKAIEIEPAMCDELNFTCYLYYEALHDDGFVEREESQGYSSDPALALFWAIYKVLKEEH